MNVEDLSMIQQENSRAAHFGLDGPESPGNGPTRDTFVRISFVHVPRLRDP